MNTKTIVFDLDETIGSFSQLNMLWNLLQNHYSNRLTQNDFNILCDNLPNYFRREILDVFRNICNADVNIIIYTNNNGPKKWTLMIKNYIESKIGNKLFDKVICAYMADGVIIEKKRTTYEKTYEDLLRCTKYSKKHKFLFFDNLTHPYMYHNNVKNIKVSPHICYYNINKLKKVIEIICNKYSNKSPINMTILNTICINDVKNNIVNSRKINLNIDKFIKI